tara:strand:- start:432 stop:533 length:102 start_codon:yes stop_codon:yes gene_type:complete
MNKKTKLQIEKEKQEKRAKKLKQNISKRKKIKK